MLLNQPRPTHTSSKGKLLFPLVLFLALTLLGGLRFGDAKEPGTERSVVPGLSPATTASTPSSPALDLDYIALCEKRVEVARIRFETAKNHADGGNGTRAAQAEAELALAEAEYALKKAKEPQGAGDGVSREVPELATLQAERQRLLQQAQTLQDSIRQRTTEAAIASGLANGESLKRDVALEETKFAAMQARRTAALDRINNPGQIPPLVLMQIDPKLRQLDTERKLLQQRRDALVQTVSKSDSDPRIRQIDKQMEELDAMINKIISAPEGNGQQAAVDAFRANEELILFTLEQDIRAQAILVDTLRKKHGEQLEDHAKRAASILDSTFEQTQLDRTNKILAQIDERILALRMTPPRAEDGAVPRAVLGLNPATTASTPSSPALLTRTLLVQGKTFEQWQELLQTELDPTIRTEAIRAFTLFGANGRGKEATEAIVDAVKGVSFVSLGNPNNDPVEKLKHEVVKAFSHESVRIPVEDSLPILLERFMGSRKGEQQFVQMVLWGIVGHFDTEQFALCYNKLMQWDVKDPQDQRPTMLLRVISGANDKSEIALKFLRETIQKNDAVRFQWLFADFTPSEIERVSERVGARGGTREDVRLYIDAETHAPMGIIPITAGSLRGTDYVEGDGNNRKWYVNPCLTPFGRALLDLLRSEGIKSGNAVIRTRSQEVLEVLSQIDELEKE